MTVHCQTMKRLHILQRCFGQICAKTFQTCWMRTSAVQLSCPAASAANLPGARAYQPLDVLLSFWWPFFHESRAVSELQRLECTTRQISSRLWTRKCTSRKFYDWYSRKQTLHVCSMRLVWGFCDVKEKTQIRKNAYDLNSKMDQMWPTCESEIRYLEREINHGLPSLLDLKRAAFLVLHGWLMRPDSTSSATEGGRIKIEYNLL